MLKYLFFTMWALLFTLPARAEILFEAYYRIESRGEPVGYVIQQLAEDRANQTRSIRYYTLRKNDEGVERSGVESVTTLTGSAKSVKTWTRQDDLSAQATAAFADKKVTVRYLAPDFKKLLRDETLDTPKNAGISSFVLNALAAKNAHWKGAQKYEAFVEENMRFAEGEVFLRAEIAFEGVPVRQLEDNLLSERMELFSFADGNILGSRSEDGTQVVYLVKDQKTATAEMPFMKQEVMDHFGGRIPDGRTHPLIEKNLGGLRDWLKLQPSAIPRRPGSVSMIGGGQ
ncbi:MAG: hypothetical protein KF767_07630 [Bdellovibrionaceae bacterium]|nr:hypothetical protein [Pseudobdellovibrionaceae bacterium]